MSVTGSDGGSSHAGAVLVRVDTERCIGSGMCELLAEDHFEVTADGVVALLRQPLLDRALAAELVQRCPSQALSVDEAGSGTR